MTEIRRLRETVTALEKELHELDTLDNDARDVLIEALAEIRQALLKGHAEDSPHGSLSERLSAATQQFEASHPALTRTLAGLIDGLGQMGI